MGKKLEEQKIRLHRAVDEVLHYIWDPIGVSGIPGARNEYFGYMPRVISILNSSSDARKIAEYLNAIEKDSMGLPQNPDRAMEVARILIDWYEEIFNN